MPVQTQTDDERMLDAYRRLVADAHELVHVTRRVSDQEARRAGATVSQWHVLSVISDGARTVPSIAQRLGLSRQAVQRTCTELIEAGMAVAVDNPAHRRSPIIEATPAGLDLQRSLYDASGPARLAAIQRAELTIDELVATGRGLRRLLDAMAPTGERADRADLDGA